MSRLRSVLVGVVALATVVAGLVVATPQASADWAHDPCSNAQLYEQWKTEVRYEAVGEYRQAGSLEVPVSTEVQLNWSNTYHASAEVGASIGVGEIVSIGASASATVSHSKLVGGTHTVKVNTAKGEIVRIQNYVIWREVWLFRTWVNSQFVCDYSNRKQGQAPEGTGLCVFKAGSNIERACRASSGGSSGGSRPSPGTPPTGPQPVTSVYGLADGTVLATTDSKRIYKMVGGAPVWQATCDDGICQPQARPTTQAVIDAGPRTPRNGSSAIDQRGRVYLFVGGTPLWQESCAAPVTCGSPVKISNWSIDARDHMNRTVADGNLVQARSNGTDLPVAVTVGGALVTFASPQEVIDSGYGSDWAGRVVAISAGSYNGLGFEPSEATLVQGAAGGTSTPVGTFVAGVVVPFASPQEVVDVGYGTDWRSKVRGIPARVFNARLGTPREGALVQGAAGGAATPVAMLAGGARINLASPQEALDAGYGTDWASRVRVIPTRAFNAIPTQITSGTLVKKPYDDGIGVVLGGHWTAFHSLGELAGAGYDVGRTRTIPARVLDAMPRGAGDSTLLKKPGDDGVGVVLGGGWVPFFSEAEVKEAGYDLRATHTVPARVLDAMPRTIGNGVLVKKPGHDGVGVMLGGGWVSFHSMEELSAAGYGGQSIYAIPPRVLDALPTTIGDGTLIRETGSPTVWKMTGGARAVSPPDGPVWTVPPRVLKTVATSFPQTQAARATDFNGDTKDDVAAFTRRDSGDVYVATSTGTGFAGNGWKWHDWFAPGQELPGGGDFNGDGKDDIATFTRGTTGSVYVALSNGSGFAPATVWAKNLVLGAELPAVGDFDGDGKDDIATFTRGDRADVSVALSDATRFVPTGGTWHDWFAADVEVPAVGDFDGDGKDDIATFTRGSDAKVYVALSTGTRFEGGSVWNSWFAAGEEVPAIGDFDGDGKDDIATFTRGEGADVHVALSDGGRFVSRGKWHDRFAVGGEVPGVGDFDGDGKDDIVTFTRGEAADVYVSLSDGTKFVQNGVKWHDHFAAGAELPLPGAYPAGL